MQSFIVSALIAATSYAGLADYTTNGADWPDLCQTGEEQSPIDLVTDGATLNADLDLELTGYFNFPTSIDPEADPTYTAVVPDGPARESSFLKKAFSADAADDEFFTFRQFHLHAPSEHTVNGHLLDAEVHFVHTNLGSGDVDPDTGARTNETYGSVIGIFFDREVGGSEENAFLNSLFAAVESQGTADPLDVDVLSFLAANLDVSFWSYPGSFTTPPCTEGIRWNVMTQVQSISEEQLTLLQSRLPEQGNNRITLPLHARVLEVSGAISEDFAERAVVVEETTETNEEGGDVVTETNEEGGDVETETTEDEVETETTEDVSDDTEADAEADAGAVEDTEDLEEDEDHPCDHETESKSGASSVTAYAAFAMAAVSALAF